MDPPLNLRSGATRLPIVMVDFLIGSFARRSTMICLTGVRRSAVEMALLSLESARQNQIDGVVELSDQATGIVLRAAMLTIDRLADIVSDECSNDEQN